MKEAQDKQTKHGRNKSMCVNIKINVSGLILTMKRQKTLEWKILFLLNLGNLLFSDFSIGGFLKQRYNVLLKLC